MLNALPLQRPHRERDRPGELTPPPTAVDLLPTLRRGYRVLGVGRLLEGRL